ncbi:VAMP-associated protein [Guyanagaster necrorhizus]|uniref:VAMP-associated protein n=1 Tax=Guyanagaster necrorhizus TaxID=856835 RepID=A0A9P7VH18_9AGAR|nr:VAMP-associated protein [Guyanagaster necrorhizus MCA 3950]KAG7440878.1 VAMP-associated protein [Guyanagaster necrorhizus MCA 3950]
MSVYLNPSNTLGFTRPLTVLVKRSLSITNPNAQPIAFKVKTTAPRLYCVRPNSGRVEPGETVEVSVMLQAMKEEPPINAKCKDKFLIQSTLITPEKESRALQDIWSVTEGATDDTKVFQQKLKVTYLRREGETLEEVDETLANQSSMMNTSDSQYDTVRQVPITNDHPALIPEFNQSTSEERPATPPNDFSAAREEEHHEEPPTKQIPSPPVSVFVQPAPEPAPPVEQPSTLAPSPPSDELLVKYREAEAEIERLRSLLAAAAPPPQVPPETHELRRRTRRLSDDMTITPGSEVGTMIGEEVAWQPDGVPLQIVVIIALGVFIVTYLFF